MPTKASEKLIIKVLMFVYWMKNAIAVTRKTTLPVTIVKENVPDKMK